MKTDLLERTKIFAVSVIHYTQTLPPTSVGKVIGNQLLRSGTSVGANHRSAQRAKSRSDFIYKIKIAEEEADESFYWLELILASMVSKEFSESERLLKEANELTAILGSIAIKSKAKSEC